MGGAFDNRMTVRKKPTRPLLVRLSVLWAIIGNEVFAAGVHAQ